MNKFISCLEELAQNGGDVTRTARNLREFLGDLASRSRPLGVLLFLLVPLIAARGQEANGTSTISFGVGGTWVLVRPHELPGGPQFDGSYEYRFRKHWAVELGVDTTVTTYFYPSYSYYGGGSPTAGHISAITFGFRYVYPLSRGRAELFAGLQGAYIWGPNNYSEWAAMLSVGGRLAVDKQKHCWLGSTARYVNDFGYPQGRWFTATADLGFRFGH